MDHLIASYQEHSPSTRYYLDGSYFNKVLKDYPGLEPNPIVVSFYECDDREEILCFKSEIDISLRSKTPFGVNTQDSHEIDGVQLVRLIIQVKNERGEILSRHSNLIIIHHPDRKVYRFEPMDLNCENPRLQKLTQYSSDVEDMLNGYFPYECETLDFHPQHIDCSNPELDGMCLAYVLKAAVLFALGDEINDFGDFDDIKRFARAVEDSYSAPTGEPNIEFGVGSFLGGALLGGLAGTVIGSSLNNGSYYGYGSPYMGYGSPYPDYGFYPAPYVDYGYPRYRNYRRWNRYRGW